MKRVLLAILLVMGLSTTAAADPLVASNMVGPPHLSYNHTAVAPEGYELVYRSVIVRLGPSWNWYENAAHGSAGIIGVTIDGTTRELVVETDFDAAAGEKILYAGASSDATLVGKGVSAGASGGSNITRYTIVSSKDLPGGYAAYLPIRPNGSCFDSNVDNLWIVQVSMRPKAS
jgi:hypothetical protein